MDPAGTAIGLVRFLTNPPPVREMVVRRTYAQGPTATPDQYYLVRYTTNAFVLARATSLESLLLPPQPMTNSPKASTSDPAFLAVGRHGSTWWTVAGIARAVATWNQDADPDPTNNPVRLGTQAQLPDLTELLLFGINDITLTPDIYGTWSILDDTFGFASQRTFQGRLIRSRFSGRVERDPSGRVRRLLLTKTLHDPRLSKPGSWTYRLDYEYRPGPRPPALPFLVRKFLVQTNGLLRPLDTLTYLRIDVANTELDPALFEPETFALPASFRLHVSADGLYYIDEQGVTNLVTATFGTQDSFASTQRVVFYAVLALLLLLPLTLRYLRRRSRRP